MPMLFQLRIPACLVAMLALLMGAPLAAKEEEGTPHRSGRLTVDPYIEASQVLNAELSPGNDTVTYTRLAAGVDADIDGRNTKGALSLRYEHRFGWGDAPDSDIISGIARGSIALVPRTLTFEAGALATHARTQGNGGAVLGSLVDGVGSTDIYSIYAGPSLRTNFDDLEVTANYRFGYTRVEDGDVFLTGPNGEGADVFEESTVHMANVRAGFAPDTLLPVGVGVGGGIYREDISNLDQRIDDRYLRADVTVPVSPTLAFVGGIGYEDVEISSRDALRDGSGNPVIGPDGRYVTDKSSPRRLAYDVDGLIWDVGVLWRPSPRTSLEAHVGRRYGATSVYGNFSWQATRRSQLNISVYDNVAGFGGQLNRAIDTLPTDFAANRNPISGDLFTCVGSTQQGATCLDNVLGSIRSATFRARGVAATYSVSLTRIDTGVGVGYDRRKFIAAEGTILESANGLTDENIWLAAYLNYRFGDRSSLDTSVRINWFDSGFDLAGDLTSFSATTAYSRVLADRLTGTVALGLDGLSREQVRDLWIASALVGLRYHF